MENYNKFSSKMYRQLVQQKVQQKVNNNHAALLIKQFVLTKLMKSLYY